LETPPALAISVAVCVELTGNTVALNPALATFAGTVTVAGTVTAASLLDGLTLSPLPDAAALNVTVQASVPDPAMVELLQYRALGTPGTGSPVPLRPITAVGLVEEVLAIVS
jgi:hypothetical protein